MGLCRERSEDIVESVLFFFFGVESKDETQVIRPAWQVFLKCGHLGVPEQFFQISNRNCIRGTLGNLY